MILDQILRLSTEPSWNLTFIPKRSEWCFKSQELLRYWWTQVRLQESHSQTYSGTQEDSDEQECHRGDGDEPGRHAGDHDYHFQHPHILFCFMFLYFYFMYYVCICNEPGPHIGDRDHRFQHWSFWPSSYIAGCVLLILYVLQGVFYCEVNLNHNTHKWLLGTSKKNTLCYCILFVCLFNSRGNTF